MNESNVMDIKDISLNITQIRKIKEDSQNCVLYLLDSLTGHLNKDLFEQCILFKYILFIQNDDKQRFF